MLPIVALTVPLVVGCVVYLIISGLSPESRLLASLSLLTSIASIPLAGVGATLLWNLGVGIAAAAVASGLVILRLRARPGHRI